MRDKPTSFFLSILIAISAVLILPASSNASALNYSAYFKWRELMFETSLSTFDAIAKDASHRPQYFDWSSDLCSAPLVGSTGITFDFSAACRRHDFGYRNIKTFSTATTSAMRKQIDDRFRIDLRESCSRRSIWQRPTCYAWSETFYRVVRLVAGP